ATGVATAPPYSLNRTGPPLLFAGGLPNAVARPRAHRRRPARTDGRAFPLVPRGAPPLKRDLGAVWAGESGLWALRWKGVGLWALRGRELGFEPCGGRGSAFHRSPPLCHSGGQAPPRETRPAEAPPPGRERHLPGRATRRKGPPSGPARRARAHLPSPLRV